MGSGGPRVTVVARLVTRGDVDLEPIVASIRKAGIEDVSVWDNSVRRDLAVYGRYALLNGAGGEFTYVQDDDAVLEPAAIRALLDARCADAVVCNMPARFRHDFYVDHALVGFGAVFPSDLPADAFYRYWTALGAAAVSIDALSAFHRTCDIVMTALAPRRDLLDLPYEELPHAHAPNRMWKQAGHVEERTRTLELARGVRDS